MYRVMLKELSLGNGFQKLGFSSILSDSQLDLDAQPDSMIKMIIVFGQTRDKLLLRAYIFTSSINHRKCETEVCN